MSKSATGLEKSKGAPALVGMRMQDAEGTDCRLQDCDDEAASLASQARPNDLERDDGSAAGPRRVAPEKRKWGCKLARQVYLRPGAGR